MASRAEKHAALQRKYRQTEKGRARERRGQQKMTHKRREYLNAYKLARGCIDCGYRAHPEALEFDHVRGEKLFNVGNGGRSAHRWASVLEEIEKCEVVCANCHRVRTSIRRGARG